MFKSVFGRRAEFGSKERGLEILKRDFLKRIQADVGEEWKGIKEIIPDLGAWPQSPADVAGMLEELDPTLETRVDFEDSANYPFVVRKRVGSERKPRS